MTLTFDKFKVMGTHIGKRAEHIHKYVVRGSSFVLKREPENEYDKNAVQVFLAVRKGQYFLDLGYVPRRKAEELAPLMDDGVEFKASFRIKIINEKTGGLVALYLNLVKVDSEPTDVTDTNWDDRPTDADDQHIFK